MLTRSIIDTIKKVPSLEQATRRLLEYVPPSYRMSRNFRSWYAFFEETDTWNKEELIEFQMEQLRELLRELVKTSDYYRKIISLGDIQKINTIEDYQFLIPTLSRAEFRNQYPQILAKNWKRLRLSKSQTSGTTGMALQFYHLSSDDDREWAAICHQWKRVGYHPGESRRAEFRGLTKKGQLIDFFPNQNMLRCSILDLKPEHIRYYADQIKEANCTFLHGYPSALYLLALEICNSGIKFPEPEAILMASEEVFDWQLDQLFEAFPNSKLFAHYGCAERTVLAGWCEFRREYHVLPQYGLVEIDGETSEIIGTNLFNRVNGFVRYRMTDTVLDYTYEHCPECKRNYSPRLIKLGGRTEEYLFSQQNGWIPPALVTYPLKSLRSIKEIQFVQKEEESINVFYTVRSKRDSSLLKDIEQIQSGLYRLFGKDTKLEFEEVHNFPHSPSGKFKWIICELDESPQRFS